MFSYMLYIIIVWCLANGEVRGDQSPSAAPSAIMFEKEYEYLRLLAFNPYNIAANLELGLLYVECEEHILARKYLKHAIVYGNWSNVTALTNYALQLNHLNETASAFSVLRLHAWLDSLEGRKPA